MARPIAVGVVGGHRGRLGGGRLSVVDVDGYVPPVVVAGMV